MAEQTSKPPPFHEKVAENLIEQLKAGTAPWQKPWAPGELERPHNPVSGHVYKGVNTVNLMAQGQSDPRWMTYKQAQKAGAQVRPGEKGTTVQYWKFEDRQPKLGADGQPLLDDNGKKIIETVKLDRPKAFFSTVFNASQIDGLPEREIKEPSWDRHERAETILTNSGATLRHDQADAAYYVPSRDDIHLPGRGQFDTADQYYATALHELGHWTGHESRLDRDLSGPFGSESYAVEELRAEIASLMLGTELGIGHDPGQHAAYVGHWIKALEDDPREILRAAKDAEQIMGYVLGLEQEREQEQTLETGQSRDQTTEKQTEPGVSPRQEPPLYTLLGAAHLETCPDILVTAHAPSAQLAAKAIDMPVALAHEGADMEQTALALLRDAYPQHQGFILGESGDDDTARDLKQLSDHTGMPIIMPNLYGSEIEAGNRHLSDYAELRGERALSEARQTIEQGVEIGKDKLAREAERHTLLTHLASNAKAPEIGILGRLGDDAPTVLICNEVMSAETAARATGLAVVVAPTLDTLPDVAKALEAAYPEKDRLIVADLIPDHQDVYAQACEASRCETLYPDLTEAEVAMGYTRLYDYFECRPQDPWRDVRDTLETGMASAIERLAQRAMVEPEAEIAAAAPEVDTQLGRVWLYVPTWETEAAEALGAKWDDDARSHYVDAETDLAPFASWAVQHMMAEAGVRRATPQDAYFAGSGLVGDPGARENLFDAWVDSDHRAFLVAKDGNGREQNLYDLQAGSFDPHLPHEGAFAWVGQINPGREPEVLVVTTDYLSARAVYEATGIPTAVAFDSDNLPAVAQAVRERYPDPEIVILGRADQEQSAGFEREAAARCGGQRVTPAFSDAERQAGHETLHDFYQCRYPNIQRDIRQTIEAGLEAARSRQSEPEPELATARVVLHVPYAEKDYAKALGAKWDAVDRTWCAPAGTDLTPLAKWREPAEPQQAPKIDPRVEFADKLKEMGLALDGLPVMDGEMHRVPVEGGSPGSRDGAYVGHLDGRPAGYLQNHKTGVSDVWKAKGYRMNAEDKAQLQAEAQAKRQQREQERQAERQRGAEECQRIWGQCVDAAATDPYLQAKGVGAYGVLSDIDTGKLVIPAKNIEGEVRGLQIVDEDGTKRFLRGSDKTGNFHQIGERKPGEPILIAEGYATAAAIHEATGRPVIAAFDAGNLKPVAEALHAKDPGAPILICADNDHRLGDGDKNVGIHKGKEAAKAVGGRVAYPTFGKEQRDQGLSDWHDARQHRGVEHVKYAIEANVLTLQAEKDKTQEQKLDQAQTQDKEQKTQEKVSSIEL